MWMKFVKNSAFKPFPQESQQSMDVISNHRTKSVKHGTALSFLLAAIVLLMPLPMANACGITYYGEDYRVAFLDPYVIGDEYSAFFYSADQLNRYQNDTKGSDRKRNCQAWAKHVGNDATTSEVNAVVYGMSYDEFLNAVSDGAHHLPLAGNAFFQFLLKKENKESLDYLLLAKGYEHYSALESTDPWADAWSSDANAAMSAAEMGKKAITAKMEKQFKTVKDAFLKRRYAYQLLVMSRYEADVERFEQLYAEYFRGNVNDALTAWATFHRAAIVEDTAEAAYLLAQSFRDCPEKRIYCYLHFDKGLEEKALGFCKNNAEKAMVIGLAALRNPGMAMPQLQRIQSLDPKCPLLPLLLVRETSKLEDWLLTDEVTGMGTAFYPEDDSEEKWEWDSQQWEMYRQGNRKKDQLYLAKVREFVMNYLVNKEGSVTADLSNLVAAHLLLMEKKGGEAEKHLNAISPKAGAKIAEQQLTTQLLLLVNKSDITQAAVKEQLAALLDKLSKSKHQNQKNKRDFAALNLMLSQEYQRKGDLLTAFFLNNHSLDLPTNQRSGYGTAYYSLIQFLDWQATEKDIDNILAVIVKKDKSPFERYLTAVPSPSRNALLDLRGTISFRKNNLPEALAAFEKVDKDFWATKYEFKYHLVSDPFTMATDSLHRGTFPATKGAFVKTLIELENSISTQPEKAAKNYLLLGTAWLNCSYVGKSWMMFCYGNSVVEDEWGDYFSFNYKPKSKEMNQVYYNASRAFDYLQKAKGATNDKELHARIDYLMAWQQSLSHQLTQAEEDEMNSLEWEKQGAFLLDLEMSFFRNWAKSYKSTKFYKEKASTCPILATYYGR